MRMRLLSMTVVGILLLSAAYAAEAGTVNVSCEFEATFTDPDVTLTGSFSSSYDSSLVSAEGDFWLYDVALDSCSMSDIGDTSFDTTNTAFTYKFVDGVLEELRVGGLSGTVMGRLPFTDDFLAKFRGVTGPTPTKWVDYWIGSPDTSNGTNDVDFDITISEAAVPLPAAAWMGLGLLAALAGHRRLRRRRT